MYTDWYIFSETERGSSPRHNMCMADISSRDLFSASSTDFAPNTFGLGEPCPVFSQLHGRPCHRFHQFSGHTRPSSLCFQEALSLPHDCHDPRHAGYHISWAREPATCDVRIWQLDLTKTQNTQPKSNHHEDPIRLICCSSRCCLLYTSPSPRD